MTRKSKWSRWLGEAVLLSVVVFVVQAYAARGTVSGEAPALAGVTITGDPVSLAAMRGRPVLVHFWATWCPVCKMEQGSIDALAEDHAVLTVAMDEASDADIRRYLDALAVDYPVLHDPAAALGARWGVHGIPASFIVGPDGSIAFRSVGYTTGIGLRLRLWWASL